MGLENNSQGQRTFLSIMKGKLVMRVEEGTEKAITRTNKMGNTVHELYFTSLEGYLVYINTKEHEEYGKSWAIGIQDGESLYEVQLGYTSGYAMGFLKRVESLEFTQKLKLVPYYIPKEGTDKHNAVLVIYQGGNKLESNYTKDNPNGLPNWEKITVNNEEQWDSGKQMQFFEDMLTEKVKPNLPEIQTSSEGLSDTPTEEAAPEGTTDASTDAGQATTEEEDPPFVND